MITKTVDERYNDLLKDLQQQLSPFDAKSISWVDVSRRHGVGSQLLHCLIQNKKLTRVGRGRYIADPSLYDLTGAELRSMAAEYFRELRFKEQYI